MDLVTKHLNFEKSCWLGFEICDFGVIMSDNIGAGVLIRPRKANWGLYFLAAFPKNTNLSNFNQNKNL